MQIHALHDIRMYMSPVKDLLVLHMHLLCELF